ncbi:MAG TPA: alpha/beta hydrolase [Polyangiaceae bacterium]|jgi:pimeloyl-ACP methyl ester carboxylesterase
MRRPGKTPPFRGPGGEILPGSLAEAGYLHIGGLDQWVMIRGESLTNPPLVLLHGGPGFSETSLFRHYNAALEKSFTVVYWDQRGARRSYDRRIARSSMTVDRFIADLDELVDAVRQRLAKDKVTIFGHSWGSALGVLYAARFPDKVATYVGCGQIGDWPAGEAGSYAFTLAEAERRGDRRALAKLRALGPPPHTPERLWAQRTWLARFEGRFRPKTAWTFGRVVLGGPEASLFEAPAIRRGFRFSIDAMWAEASQMNLVRLVPALRMPVYFFLGRNDRWVPPDVSVAYFDALRAPSKTLVWFERSGHEPFIDEPHEFNAAMADVRRTHGRRALPPDA